MNKTKLLSILLIGLIFMLPLTIADLVYGFSGDECLTIYPEYIHVNLKVYLLVSGFLQLCMILYFIVEVVEVVELLESNKERSIPRMVGVLMVQIIYSMFMLIWNIIGGIVFWDYVYKHGHCEKDVSTYIFASIIIKLVLTYISIHNHD